MAMDSSSAQSHHQEMSSETLESMLISRKSQQEKKPRPADHVQSPNCPRCDSTNTKFCYYNNYSLSQPRYFCKSCRRYWTKGGTLRNVPVGGGCRKNRRSSSSKRSLDHQPLITTTPSSNIIHSFNIPLSYGSDDLSLAFSGLQKQTNGQLGLHDDEGGFPISPANPNMPFSDIFQNMCYGMGDGINLGLGIINGGNQEMGFEEFNGGTTTSTAVNTSMKQEICSNNNNFGIREGDQMSRGLWGFPLWQSDNNLMAGDVDSGRHGSWNGIGSFNWHELRNSPLM